MRGGARRKLRTLLIRHVKCRATVGRLKVAPCASLHEKPHDVQAVGSAGDPQRCVAIVVRRVDVGSMVALLLSSAWAHLLWPSELAKCSGVTPFLLAA
eukprot:6026930-Prymnesium_polylepis.2